MRHLHTRSETRSERDRERQRQRQTDRECTHLVYPVRTSPMVSTLLFSEPRGGIREQEGADKNKTVLILDDFFD
jgi:hypothetical protein